LELFDLLEALTWRSKRGIDTDLEGGKDKWLERASAISKA